jgi:hypothetical protein
MEMGMGMRRVHMRARTMGSAIVTDEMGKAPPKRQGEGGKQKVDNWELGIGNRKGRL